MITNIFFYTFSTIAQVLAGAIALLSAFALYKLQSIDSEIERYSGLLASAYTGVQGREEVQVTLQRAGEVNRMFCLRQFQKLLEFAETNPLPQSSVQLTVERQRLAKLFPYRRSLLRKFNIALALTISLLISSVVAIQYTDFIVNCPTVSALMLSVVLLWFLACISSYVLLVKEALEEKVEKNH